MKKVAVSACLLGQKCRYDGTDNRDDTLLQKLEDAEVIPFCPEDFVFGTPRPTMDLIRMGKKERALSNLTGEDLSEPINAYAIRFFDAHSELDLFIGKDRSPSCGVCSAKVYDTEKNLLFANGTGLMAKEAKRRSIHCVDAEDFKGFE